MASTKISALPAATALTSPNIVPMVQGGVTVGAPISVFNTYFGLTFAPKISPTFTGTPTAPTATVGTRTTQLATTAFVAEAALDLTAPTVLRDEFLFASTETGEIGELGWSFTNGTWNLVNPTAGHPGVASRASTAVTGTVASSYTGGGGTAVSLLGSQFDEQTWIILLLTSNTDADYRFGFFSDLTANPPTHGAYFEKLSTDTNWFGVNRLSAAQTRADLGVAAAHSTWFKLKLRRVNATTLAYSIDGGAETQIATHSPEAASLAFGFQIIPTNSAARTVNVDAFSMRLNAQAR